MGGNGWRKALLIVLGVAFGIEVLWPLGGFLAPSALLQLFKIGETPDTLFLTFVLAWCLLLVALVCGYAFLLVKRSERAGWALSQILGWWWVGIGGTLFLFHGKWENLILDAFKGALIVVFAYQSKPKA